MQALFHKSHEPNSKKKTLCLSDLFTPTKKPTALAKIYDRILQFGPHTLLFAWTGSSPADHGRILPRNYVLHYSEISFGRCRITDVFHFNVLLFINYLC